MSLQGPLGALPMPAFIQNRRFSVTRQKGLQISDVNPHVKSAQYAVRGELAIKSEQYRAQLLKGEGEDLPFDSVIAANIGNPQQLDQQPITFFRQVASLLENPQLLQNDEVLKNGLGYKSDVIERAKKLLADVKSVGAYSQSQGAPGIRQSVAEFIERRDGYPADPANIYLCAGASSGVNTLMNIICASPKTGVLVPIPQYPLYTATLSLMNAQCVPYYLDEANNWGTDPESIQTALKEAQSKGIDVRAVVVINPGNPTGGSLVPDDIKSVLEMAAQEKLVVLADEVYQSNVFEGEFVSFKKALRDLQRSKQNSEGRFDSVELASLHSISKGMVGECGHRGGYYEMVGFDQEVSLYCISSQRTHLADITIPSGRRANLQIRLHHALRPSHRPVHSRAHGKPTPRRRSLIRTLQTRIRWHLQQPPLPLPSPLQSLRADGRSRMPEPAGRNVPFPSHQTAPEGHGSGEKCGQES